MSAWIVLFGPGIEHHDAEQLNPFFGRLMIPIYEKLTLIVFASNFDHERTCKYGKVSLLAPL